MQPLFLGKNFSTATLLESQVQVPPPLGTHTSYRIILPRIFLSWFPPIKRTRRVLKSDLAGSLRKRYTEEERKSKRQMTAHPGKQTTPVYIPALLYGLCDLPPLKWRMNEIIYVMILAQCSSSKNYYHYHYYTPNIKASTLSPQLPKALLVLVLY